MTYYLPSFFLSFISKAYIHSVLKESSKSSSSTKVKVAYLVQYFTILNNKQKQSYETSTDTYIYVFMKRRVRNKI